MNKYKIEERLHEYVTELINIYPNKQDVPKKLLVFEIQISHIALN